MSGLIEDRLLYLLLHLVFCNILALVVDEESSASQSMYLEKEGEFSGHCGSS